MNGGIPPSSLGMVENPTKETTMDERQGTDAGAHTSEDFVSAGIMKIVPDIDVSLAACHSLI